MAKVAEFKICRHILSEVSCCMECSGKRVCHLSNEFFPLESTCQHYCGHKSPMHHVYWRVAKEERDASLADALFSEYLLDSDGHLY